MDRRLFLAGLLATGACAPAAAHHRPGHPNKTTTTTIGTTTTTMPTTTTRLRLEEWPGPSNTGVPAGTSLTTSNPPGGVLETTADGQVIDALDINGYIECRHNNVTIRRCKINSPTWGVFTNSTVTSGTTLVEDCEFNGCGYGGPEPGANHVIRRCNIYGTENGIHVTVGMPSPGLDVRDCWFHDLTWAEPAHGDGIQCSPAAANFTFHHNFIDGTGCSSAIQFQGGTTPAQMNVNWVITYNKFWLDNDPDLIPAGGGGITVRLPEIDVSANNVIFNHNRCLEGVFGVLSGSGADLTEFIGNIYDDTGLPIP